MATDEEMEADSEKTRRRSAEARNGGQRTKVQGKRRRFAGSFLLFLSFFLSSVRAGVPRSVDRTAGVVSLRWHSGKVLPRTFFFSSCSAANLWCELYY